MKKILLSLSLLAATVVGNAQNTNWLVNGDFAGITELPVLTTEKYLDVPKGDWELMSNDNSTAVSATIVNGGAGHENAVEFAKTGTLSWWLGYLFQNVKYTVKPTTYKLTFDAKLVSGNGKISTFIYCVDNPGANQKMFYALRNGFNETATPGQSAGREDFTATSDWKTFSCEYDFEIVCNNLNSPGSTPTFSKSEATASALENVRVCLNTWTNTTKVQIANVKLEAVDGSLPPAEVAEAPSNVIYVSTDGNDANDGLTWNTAVATIQTALNKAEKGWQVWVAGGTYVIDGNSAVNNSAYINWEKGVDIYGSFKKGDTSIEDRVRPNEAEPYNFANPTVITSNGVAMTYRLFNYGPKNTLATDPYVVDGITVDKYVNKNWIGVGHFAANATFRNNIVSNCSQDNGGSGNVEVYVEGNGLIENCLFENNYATQNNEKYFVARIQEGAATTAPNTVRNCVFRGNKDGYALQVYKTAGGTGTSYITGCTFEGNKAGCIGIGSTAPSAGLVIENNLFENNTGTVNSNANVYGSVISGNISAPCVIANNIIRNNENTAPVQSTVVTKAGIVTLNSSTMEFIDNLVYNNKSNNYTVFTQGLVLNNTFANNAGTMTVGTTCAFPVMNNLYVGNVGNNDRKAFVADSDSPIWFLYNGIEADNYTVSGDADRIIGTVTDVTADVFVNPTTTAGIVAASALEGVDFSLKANSKASNAGCVSYYDEDNEVYIPQLYLGYIGEDEVFQPAVDLYKKDLAGNDRVVNDKISLGCYQGPASSGVDNIFVDDVTFDNEDAPVEYYNLQGVRVANPAAGQLYIKRQGNKAVKVIM